MVGGMTVTDRAAVLLIPCASLPAVLAAEPVLSFQASSFLPWSSLPIVKRFPNRRPCTCRYFASDHIAVDAALSQHLAGEDFERFFWNPLSGTFGFSFVGDGKYGGL